MNGGYVLVVDLSVTCMSSACFVVLWCFNTFSVVDILGVWVVVVVVVVVVDVVVVEVVVEAVVEVNSVLFFWK